MIKVSVAEDRLHRCESCGEYKDSNKRLRLKFNNGKKSTEFQVTLCEDDRHQLDAKICGS